MAEIIAFPYDNRLIRDDYKQALTDSGRTFYIANTQHDLAANLRKEGLPIMIICHEDNMDALRSLAWTSEEFAGLRTIPTVVIWGGTPEFLLEREKADPQFLNVMSTLDDIRDTPKNILALARTASPLPPSSVVKPDAATRVAGGPR